MLRLLAAVLFLAFAAAPKAAGTAVEPLWPDGTPGAMGEGEAHTPALICFPAPAKTANGAAAVVCPGGAYGILAMEKEGYEAAAWLNSLGVTAFVLRYRLAPYRHPAPGNDARRAMRWVRAHARRFRVDEKRLGMVGFSAGGHLTATVATGWDEGRPDAEDSVERHSCRPVFQVLVYPVITMDPAFAHMGSRRNLLGNHPDRKLADLLSMEKRVTKGTPPAFLVHSRPDPIVSFRNSEAYYEALRKAGVHAELQAYAQGTHAYGLARGLGSGADVAGWPGACERWLDRLGMFRPLLIKTPAPR